jgi:hypothetical protein
LRGRRRLRRGRAATAGGEYGTTGQYPDTNFQGEAGQLIHFIFLMGWKRADACVLFNSAQAFEGETMTQFIARRLSLRGIKR